MKLYFMCPKCYKAFVVDGYWKWILTNPFHFFSRRKTKCPNCGKRSWNRWLMISR